MSRFYQSDITRKRTTGVLDDDDGVLMVEASNSEKYCNEH